MAIGGLTLGQELGQGAHAKVKLAVKDGEYIAVKILEKVRFVWFEGQATIPLWSLTHLSNIYRSTKKMVKSWI